MSSSCKSKSKLDTPPVFNGGDQQSPNEAESMGTELIALQFALRAAGVNVSATTARNWAVSGVVRQGRTIKLRVVRHGSKFMTTAKDVAAFLRECSAGCELAMA